MGTMGTMSEVGRIKRIALRRPEQAFVNQEGIDAQWCELRYAERPLYFEAVREYEELVALLRKFDMKIDFLPLDERLTLDSLYVRDAAVVSQKGVILCNMGKPQRKYEPRVAGAAFISWGIPVVGAIEGKGCLEGGDIVWLDDDTVAVGRTYRTNEEGIRQMKELTGDTDVISVPLPHYRGPEDVFHLMSILSPIDHDLALVYSRYMLIPFREVLIEKGINLIEVPESEFETMGCNVLAVAPRQCIMLKGNPETKARLEEAGAHVWEIKGEEISVKGQGGPTCLTRPLVRE